MNSDYVPVLFGCAARQSELLPSVTETRGRGARLTGQWIVDTVRLQLALLTQSIPATPRVSPQQQSPVLRIHLTFTWKHFVL